MINLVDLEQMLNSAVYNNYLDNARKDIQSEPSQFRFYIRSEKVVSDSPDSMKLNNNEFDTSQDITEAFAEYWSLTLLCDSK